ncbi:MAG: hypothetical protein KAY32_11580 [Candidatus Eisenbacteria sp.]|nr:hypothetical protein [Candidatus Eisenbacteria bacterium]
MNTARRPRDRALRGLLYWIPAMLYVGAMAAAGHRAAVLDEGARYLRHGTGDFLWIAALTWFMLSVYLLFAKLPERAHRLELALPLSARRIWLRRTGALLIAQMILLAVGAFGLLAGNQVTLARLAIGPDLISLAIHLAAGMALLIALAQNWQPQMAAVAMRPGSIIYFVIVWVGLFALIYLLSTRGPACALVPAGAAVVLFWRAYRLLPPAFRLVPQAPPGPEGTPAPTASRAADVALPAIATTASRAADVTPPAIATTASRAADVTLPAIATAMSGRGGSSRWLIERTLWMTFFRHWLFWFMAPVLALMGLLLAGPPAGSRTVTGPLGIFITLLFLMLIFRFGVTRTRFLDPLPISRRRIFAHLVMPPLALLFIAMSVAVILGSFSQHDRIWSQVLAVEKETPYPNQLLAIAWRGDPPAVTAPWAESHKPWQVSVSPSRSIVLYAPFDAPQGSSREFIAWQVGRAVEASLGREVPADEIRSRYLAAAPENEVRWEQWPQLLSDFGHRPLVRRLHALPLLLTMVGAVWLLYLALTIRVFYTREDRAQTLWGVISIGVPTLLWMLLRVWSMATGYDHVWRISALSVIALRDLVAAMPGGSLSAWALCVIVLSGTYLLAQKQLNTLQIPLLSISERKEWD